jgi:drug/metabolite transporter (DMT)-like permease
LSALICAAAHFLNETSVIPSAVSLMAAIVIGVVPSAIANVVWDAGLQRGDSQLLAVMAYGTPLCSGLMLISLGLESFTWKLLLGALLIVVAGVLSRTDSRSATGTPQG